jgi:hypothetical protein
MEKPAPTREAVIRNYEYFSFTALLTVVLILVERGSGLLSLIPFLMGLGGIAGSWRLAVPLFLLAVTFAITCTNVSLFTRLFTSYWEYDPLSDWLLSAAVLAYAAGQCRLQGASGSVLPRDPRLPRSPSPTAGHEAGRRADFGRELLVVALAVIIWAALAPVAWDRLPGLAREGLPEPVWQALAPLVEPGHADAFRDLWARIWHLVILAWLLILGTIVCRGLLNLMSWGRRRPDEALMFLQDIFWRETRGEQRRLFRRLAWERLRRERCAARGPTTPPPTIP